MYQKQLLAGWGDMDFNAHMRNTAYLDKSADVRMLFFAEHGFPMSEFRRLRLGPVMMKDEIEYYREANLLDQLSVSLVIDAMAEDGSRFRMRNGFLRPDGRLAAQVTSTGGWMDLGARKLTVPPPALLAALNTLSRSDDFEVLPSSLK